MSLRYIHISDHIYAKGQMSIKKKKSRSANSIIWPNSAQKVRWGRFFAIEGPIIITTHELQLRTLCANVIETVKKPLLTIWMDFRANMRINRKHIYIYIYTLQHKTRSRRKMCLILAYMGRLSAASIIMFRCRRRGTDIVRFN